MLAPLENPQFSLPENRRPLPPTKQLTTSLGDSRSYSLFQGISLVCVEERFYFQIGSEANLCAELWVQAIQRMAKGVWNGWILRFHAREIDAYLRASPALALWPDGPSEAVTSFDRDLRSRLLQLLLLDQLTTRCGPVPSYSNHTLVELTRALINAFAGLSERSEIFAELELISVNPVEHSVVVQLSLGAALEGLVTLEELLALMGQALELNLWTPRAQPAFKWVAEGKQFS
jgi:hypothetical protein